MISPNWPIARLIALVGEVSWRSCEDRSIGSGASRAIRDDHYRPCRLVPISIYRNIRGVGTQFRAPPPSSLSNQLPSCAAERIKPPPLFGLIADTGHISSFVGGEHSAWLRSGKDGVPQVFRAPGKFNGPLFFLDCALG